MGILALNFLMVYVPINGRSFHLRLSPRMALPSKTISTKSASPPSLNLTMLKVKLVLLGHRFLVTNASPMRPLNLNIRRRIQLNPKLVPSIWWSSAPWLPSTFPYITTTGAKNGVVMSTITWLADVYLGALQLKSVRDVPPTFPCFSFIFLNLFGITFLMSKRPNQHFTRVDGLVLHPQQVIPWHTISELKRNLVKVVTLSLFVPWFVLVARTYATFVANWQELRCHGSDL